MARLTDYLRSHPNYGAVSDRRFGLSPGETKDVATAQLVEKFRAMAMQVGGISKHTFNRLADRAEARLK